MRCERFDLRDRPLGSRSGVQSRPLRATVAILAIVALALGLAACGGGSSTADSPKGSAPTSEVLKLPIPPKKGTFAEKHPGYAKYGSPPLVFEVTSSGKAYTAKKAVAKEGNVTLELINPTSQPQNVAVEALPSHGRVVTETIKDGLAAIAVTLNTKEKFVFYSTVPGMREAGMEGTLKVVKR